MPLKNYNCLYLFMALRENPPRSLNPNRKQNTRHSPGFLLNLKKKKLNYTNFISRQNKRPRLLHRLKELREVTKTVNARAAVGAFVEVSNRKRFAN